MSNLIELKVPDIGGHASVDVIEVFVKPGATVSVDDSLITLETDKATMEVPAEIAGMVKELLVKVGDKVSEGDVIALVEAAGASAAASASAAAVSAPAAAPAPAPAAPAAAPAAVGRIEVTVPDIGGHAGVDVIEVSVKVGDTVAVDDSLITLETDKATMEVPSTTAGLVVEVKTKVGDKVGQGDLIIVVEGAGAATAPAAEAPKAAAPAAAPAPVQAAAPVAAPVAAAAIDEASFAKAHAGPSVRRLARELGVNLGQVKGTGRKGRVIDADVKEFVKGVLSGAITGVVPGAAAAAGGGAGLDLLPWPKVDFAKFGPVETKPLSRIQKLSGANLHRNWVVIPHVTFNDEADITELEEFRKTIGKEWEKSGLKVSPLAFIIKAAVEALKAFPTFNSSLDGDNLVLKQYYHIGFAADTPNGLVVPVIKDADKKGLKEIAQELTTLSGLAREGKLKPTDMQGATFTISSLGGIGGSSFTPIINAPEVAILGVCKSQIKPVWNGKEFAPRLMCPLSLSFDHRVIDGAAAAKFTVHLGKLLTDIRRLVL
jgi:pyruvate dehydrogenase E2 component (dihydrolipoamide acetyltransferase)